MEVIFLLRCLMEKYREARKNFHMIWFLLTWRGYVVCFEKKGFPLKYIKMMEL